ncbi:hypothetical protein ACLK17_13790 [Escherichia coli]
MISLPVSVSPATPFCRLTARTSGQIAINRHVGKIGQAVSFKVGIKLTCQRHTIGRITSVPSPLNSEALRATRISCRSGANRTIADVDSAAGNSIN